MFMDISAIQSMQNVFAANGISNTASSRLWSDTEMVQPPATKEKYSSKLSEIAAKYDVKHMTADQVGVMALELRDNGLISTNDFLSMALVPYLMKDGDEGAKAAMDKSGAIDLTSYWDIVSVKPSDADSGQKLFDELMKSRSEAAKSAAETQAAAVYANAIKTTSYDAARIATVVDALAAHAKAI
jgi:hypothetical protein